MPVAGVSFEWEDQSWINPAAETPVVDNVDRPIYMTVITSDKGPETWKRKVFGKRFFNLYGTRPDFRRHGQPLVQAAVCAQAGAYQTIKRVVADDSTLANLVLIARVTKTLVAAIDPTSGNPIWEYTDPTTGSVVQVISAVQPVPGTAGIPATVPVSAITQVLVDAADIDFRLQAYSVAGNNMNAFVQQARALYDSTGTPALGSSGDYPLCIIADSGRGVSNKNIRIYATTTDSSPLNYYKYVLEISENGTVLESIPFTLNPDINEEEKGKEKPVNRSLETAVFQKSDQVRARFFDDIYWDMIENLEFITQVSNLSMKDVIFGYDEYRVSIPNLNTNASPLLDSAFGAPLLNGSNGMFGNAPIKLPRTGGMNVVDIQIRNAFTGNTDDGDTIYDLDANRIDCVFDANYQQPIKRAIEQLVNFREDCVYFRDFGTEATTIPQIKQINTYGSHSRFVASYINFYKIYDPFTRKPIEVTVTYDLAQLFVDHFINGRVRPFCGQKYGITIPSEDYIPGSINFIPRTLPGNGNDQKKVFDDLRLNYLNMYDGDILTMETCYTSQTEYTQLSWVNNVLEVQEVIKAIRVFCPKERYTFLDGDDLVQYKKDVQEMVIDKFKGKFKEITIEYASNAAYDSNKIIYAIIKVKFRNFIQTEKFKVICLQS